MTSPPDERTIEQVAADEKWHELGVLAQDDRARAFFKDRGLPDPAHRGLPRFLARVYDVQE